MKTQNEQHEPISTQRLKAMRRQLIDYNKGLAPKPNWDDEAHHQLMMCAARQNEKKLARIRAMSAH